MHAFCDQFYGHAQPVLLIPSEMSGNNHISSNDRNSAVELLNDVCNVLPDVTYPLCLCDGR